MGVVVSIFRSLMGIVGLVLDIFLDVFDSVIFSFGVVGDVTGSIVLFLFLD